jgi:hypothetical protein
MKGPICNTCSNNRTHTSWKCNGCGTVYCSHRTHNTLCDKHKADGCSIVVVRKCTKLTCLQKIYPTGKAKKLIVTIPFTQSKSVKNLRSLKFDNTFKQVYYFKVYGILGF